MKLSREQARASSYLAGPVRVVAGAGTGKTAVIAERFRRLVGAGTDPSSILVMTFTERAAAEMRARIEAQLEAALGSWSGSLWVGTFHSTAQSLLREEGWRTGVPVSFGILAGAERWIVLRELLWEIGDPALVAGERPDDLVTPLLRLLERFKQELLPLGRVAAWAAAIPDRERGAQMAAAVNLFRAYDRRCRELRLLDFDDLLVRFLELLQGRPEVLAGLVKRFTAVLVDEYQDSNLAQERIVELLGSHGRVTVVGDDDQSIYRFRGASLAALERFQAAFPTARTSSLGRNRRSSANITAAASSVIAHNQDRIPKQLSASAAAGPPLRIWRCEEGLDEALAIADEIRRLQAAGQSLSSIGLLVRTNALTRLPILALRASGIPFQLWGARGFYRRPEILDAIAHLRVINDPADEVALTRLLGAPGSSIDVEAALGALREGRAAGIAPEAALASWGGAMELLERLRRLRLAATRLGVDELFFELMSVTRYLEVASFASEGEARQAAANLGKLAELLEAYTSRRTDHSLGRFMAHLDLVLLSEVDEEVAQAEDVEDAVQVMTIHQAKGLEFDAVFIPALVEGRLPQLQRADRLDVPAGLEAGSAGAPREDHLAEERRLLYVAMTRARRLLYLSWAARYEGARNWKPSRFLDEARASGGGRFIESAVAPLAGFSQALVEPWMASAAHPPRELLAPPGRLRLSFSGIETYRECPRRYRFRYVHRLPAPPTPEAQYGDIAHLVLQRLGILRRGGEEINGDVFERVYTAAWEERPFADPRRRGAYQRLGREQLGAYLAGGGLAEPPLEIETPFSADLEGWTLRGVIDRIDSGPRGARIVDYKTGTALPASRLRRDLQLALYALGAERALDLPAFDLQLVYLKEARTVIVERTAELLAGAEEAGREVAEAIAAGHFEARPERRRCALCPYRLACTEAL